MMPRQSQYINLEFRKRQIDTLKVFNENVVEVVEHEEYCVHFESGGKNIMLTVQLGINYPNERPKLLISPPLQHPWVNPLNGELELIPSLLNYTPHLELGRIVQTVVHEFERQTQSIIAKQIGGNSMNILNSAVTPTKTKQQPTSAKSLDSVTDTSQLNDCVKLPNKYNDNSLPNLSTLSLEELKQLDTDPEFFDDFIEEMSVVQHLNEELDSMINQVEIISRENQSKETHLVELKRKLSDDVTTLKHLGEKCDELNKKYLKKSEEYAPQHIRELLQIAASTADAECEHHVEHFLNGKIDVQTFLNNYTLSKKISAERKAKEERLGQQLNALERAGF